VSSASVIVVELDDVCARRHPRFPNLYVAVCLGSIDDRFKVLLRGRGPSWIRGRIQILRTDLSINYEFKDLVDAKEARMQLERQLQAQGFTVNRNTDVWTVYVIELDTAATKDPGLGFVYVGETKRDPHERFLQHINKASNSRTRLYSAVVAKHGQRLRMDLAPTEKYFDRESSKRAEADWAEHLRNLGYTVKGGH
jgi:hypothetical protein